MISDFGADIFDDEGSAPADPDAATADSEKTAKKSAKKTAKKKTAKKTARKAAKKKTAKKTARKAKSATIDDDDAAAEASDTADAAESPPAIYADPPAVAMDDREADAETEPRTRRRSRRPKDEDQPAEPADAETPAGAADEIPAPVRGEPEQRAESEPDDDVEPEDRRPRSRRSRRGRRGRSEDSDVADDDTATEPSHEVDDDGTRRKRRRRRRRKDRDDPREEDRSDHGRPQVREPLIRSVGRAAVVRAQRIAVLVDIAELLEQRPGDDEIAFSKLLRRVAGQRDMIRAVAYGKGAVLDELGTTLRHNGYETVRVEPGDSLSVALAVDAMALASRVDCIVVVPGSDTLAHLATTLRGTGVRVESASFEDDPASRLERQFHHALGRECTFVP